MAQEEQEYLERKIAEIRENKKKRKKRRKKILLCLAAVILAILLAVAVAAFLGRHPGQDNPEKTTEGASALPFDSDAVPSDRKETPEDSDAILQQLQKELEESDFRVQINTEIRVKDNVADLLICNPVENSYDMIVTITGANGETYYESGELAPGAQILTAAMEQLSPGTFPATATFRAIGPDSAETLGQVTVDLTITVE